MTTRDEEIAERDRLAASHYKLVDTVYCKIADCGLDERGNVIWGLLEDLTKAQLMAKIPGNWVKPEDCEYGEHDSIEKDDECDYCTWEAPDEDD